MCVSGCPSQEALKDLGRCRTFTGVALGRRARLEALFDAHGKAVYAFARRRTGSADADEVVSETFLVAWRRLDDVPTEALPWLLGVARRCLANLDRGEARQGAVRLRLASSALALVTDAADPSTQSAEMRRSLARLSPGERDAITLVAWEGLTPDEAAVALRVLSRRCVPAPASRPPPAQARPA